MSLDPNPSRGITLAEHLAALKRRSSTFVPGAGATYWTIGEKYSMVREPTYCLDVPSPREVREVLWRCRAVVASYNRPADAMYPPNAWLYVCRNQNYRVEDLESAARRDVRRALREFRYEFIDEPTLLDKGVAAFCDTRSRVGLADGTPETFRHHFRGFLDSPENHVLAAWRDEPAAEPFLAAFMSLSIIDDWVVIAAYAATKHLRFCPNNGLLHSAMDLFLAQRKLQGIDYGLSSIQEIGKADSLHRFKVRMGFEAIPIHRAFVFHPMLRPLANPLTLWGLRTWSRLQPKNRRLRKATGLLAAYLGKHCALAGPQETGDS
ncbi:MAG: hypothetical protein ABFC63_01360 [Thermoguttaceae bacterium]